MSPCTRCKERGLRCLTSPMSKRCNECVRSNSRGCNVSAPSENEWLSLQKEEERLRSETRATRDTVATALARLNRLEQQQDLLKTRGAEMLRRGLKTLDELDAAEAREREAAADPVPPSSASEVLVNNDLISALSPLFWQQWDVAGGNPPIAPDS